MNSLPDFTSEGGGAFAEMARLAFQPWTQEAVESAGFPNRSNRHPCPQRYSYRGNYGATPFGPAQSMYSTV